ncbi:hypothetical protein ACTPEF_26875, partial [Clostridioides difficile]
MSTPFFQMDFALYTHCLQHNLAPDYEKIVDLNPDLTIVSSGLSEADTKFIDKLKELGLNYV